VANLPITLYPGMAIGQISFIPMPTATDNPYGSGSLGFEISGPARP
jgi:dCTP deaminase